MVKILKEALGSLAEATRKAENRAHGMKVPDNDVTKTQSGDLVDAERGGRGAHLSGERRVYGKTAVEKT